MATKKKTSQPTGKSVSISAAWNKSIGQQLSEPIAKFMAENGLANHDVKIVIRPKQNNGEFAVNNFCAPPNCLVIDPETGIGVCKPCSDI